MSSTEHSIERATEFHEKEDKHEKTPQMSHGCYVDDDLDHNDDVHDAVNSHQSLVTPPSNSNRSPIALRGSYRGVALQFVSHLFHYRQDLINRIVF